MPDDNEKDWLFESKYAKARAMQMNVNNEKPHTLALHEVSSTMIAHTMLPDGGESMLRDEDKEFIRERGAVLTTQAFLLSGDLLGPDGEKIDINFADMNGTMIMICKDNSARIELLMNVLAQILDDEGVGMVMSIVMALINSRMDDGEKPTAVSQLVIDAHAINGVETFSYTNDSKPMPPTPEALDVLFGFRSNEEE